MIRLNILLLVVCLIFASRANGQLQTLDEEKVVQRMVAIDENFQSIRKKCLALFSIEYSIARPSDGMPMILRFDCIHGQEASKKCLRRDWGFGGDALFPDAPAQWQWVRNLQVGNNHIQLEGNAGGGTDGGKGQQSFFKTFDPLCFTVAPIGDMVSGQIDENWYSRKLLPAEVSKWELLRNGDIKLMLITSTKRKVACELVLGKSVGFMPVKNVYFLNDAKDQFKEFIRGRTISESTVRWQKSKDLWVPVSVELFRREAEGNVRHNYECKLEWIIQDFNDSVIFDEDKFRSRWDSIESLHFHFAK